MDKDRPPHRSQLFTVRLWLEELGEGQVEWRGQVQHVLSGEVRYFHDWPALLTQLQALLAEAQTKD
ncbi:MAG: hypothetical protein L0332_25245 [Chloroflexi bacterium]|nr:hypothetical protein [Chloroflexota bacterium]MCI0575197.1 hypothetical protein [Chloroflexota bacterium]MCI0647121.1 hypothetical protein [Chloroflexota bacterium]MCI0730003.1 hypothetical protein [Chloroflexota bacterium]